MTASFHGRMMGLSNPAFLGPKNDNRFITVAPGDSRIGPGTRHAVGLTRTQYFYCFWKIKTVDINATGDAFSFGGGIAPWWKDDAYAWIPPDGDGNQYVPGNNIWGNYGNHGNGYWVWPPGTTNFPPPPPDFNYPQYPPAPEYPPYFDTQPKMRLARGTGVRGGEYAGVTANSVSVQIGFGTVYYDTVNQLLYPEFYVSDEGEGMFSTDTSELPPGADVCGTFTITIPGAVFTVDIYKDPAVTVNPGMADVSFTVLESYG